MKFLQKVNLRRLFRTLSFKLKDKQQVELFTMGNENSKKIVASLDKAIANGPWDKSLFLQAIGKKLQDLRQDFATKLELTGGNNNAADATDHLSTQHAAHERQREVFISLYNADGNNLSKWKRLLLNLGQHIVNRPIYSDKSAIQTLIRSKENKHNEAYAVAKVYETDITPDMDQQVTRDRLGQELTAVADGIIKAEHITCFVHVSGYYRFVNNTLIREGDAALAI